MTTLSRATGKALSKSAVTFKVIKNMVKRAVDTDSTSLVKSLSQNRTKLDDQFIDLCYCYESYKSDTMANDKLTEEEFNSCSEGKPKYQYNDVWMNDVTEEYYSLVDASDNKLESLSPSAVEMSNPQNFSEDKSKVQTNDRLVSSLTGQIETASSLISSSILL